MKLHLWIYAFPVLEQFSFYALLIGIYFFSKRYFLYNRLAVFLVISLTIIKIYGNLGINTEYFQVSPFRLDLWLLVLFLAYWKGLHHWIVGAFLGFLIVFHHSFGAIYTLSYVQVLLLLCLIDIKDRRIPFKGRLKEYSSLYMKNVVLVIISFLIYKMFFAPEFPEAGEMFRKYNIGFLPISRRSFYWYVPGLLSALFLLLLKNRPRQDRGWSEGPLGFSTKYFQTSLFLIFLAIGNSLYFFGRSHENNILNVSGILMLVLFLFLDVLGFEINKDQKVRAKKFVLPVFSGLIILVISCSYAERAVERIKRQYKFLTSGNASRRLYYQSPVDLKIDEVKRVTHNSRKVIFISNVDFYYYYEGGYAPPENFYCFTQSWFYKEDLVNFWNTQLSKGYYLLIPADEFSHYLPNLVEMNHNNATLKLPDFVVIFNP
ncbi:MAG: hypothetical protein HQL24_09375 [Candidatus Omnitrophica bacterium]|nr:hypothetical protein [Candidatus Omnitrophota bacterium]